MAKTSIKKRFTSVRLEKQMTQELRQKYYNVFRNKFEVNGIDDQWSEDYLFNQLYSEGSVLVCEQDGLGPQPFN